MPKITLSYSLYDFFDKYGFLDGDISDIGFETVAFVCSLLQEELTKAFPEFEWHCAMLYISTTHNDCMIAVYYLDEKSDEWVNLEIEGCVATNKIVEVHNKSCPFTKEQLQPVFDRVHERLENEKQERVVMKLTKYHYQAKVLRVYDGDTCTVDIDLGFNIIMRNEKIRLFRINAPELRGNSRKEGKAARDFLRSLIDGKQVILKTYRDKKGKYGRYLADIWLETEQGWINVNDEMVAKGHAVFKKY
jgi:micrococcal nuclease